MGSVFKGIEKLGPAELVLEVILASLLGILLLVGFIVLRRWYRARYFHKRNQRTVALRSQWDDILSGKIPAEDWRLNPLDCDIVESILLDSIEMSPADKLPPLWVAFGSAGCLICVFTKPENRADGSSEPPCWLWGELAPWKRSPLWPR